MTGMQQNLFEAFEGVLHPVVPLPCNISVFSSKGCFYGDKENEEQPLLMLMLGNASGAVIYWLDLNQAAHLFEGVQTGLQQMSAMVSGKLLVPDGKVPVASLDDIARMAANPNTKINLRGDRG
jgi:hypothetical protein